MEILAIPIFLYTTQNINRRTFITPKSHISFFKHSLAYSDPKFFNNLPLKIKQCTILRRFCFKARKWLLFYSKVENFLFWAKDPSELFRKRVSLNTGINMLKVPLKSYYSIINCCVFGYSWFKFIFLVCFKLKLVKKLFKSASRNSDGQSEQVFFYEDLDSGIH